MALLPATESFLESVERHSGNKFRHRNEIGHIIECTNESLRGKFDDLIFTAKFLSRAYDILRRQHINPEETEKLSREFAARLEQIPPLIEAIIAGSPSDFRKALSETFFPKTRSAMEKLMVLLRELSWVKNYLLDGGRTPDVER